jgi:hypothetical protein
MLDTLLRAGQQRVVARGAGPQRASAPSSPSAYL